MTILTNVGMNVMVQSCFDVVQWSDNERKRLNEKLGMRDENIRAEKKILVATRPSEAAIVSAGRCRNYRFRVNSPEFSVLYLQILWKFCLLRDNLIAV